MHVAYMAMARSYSGRETKSKRKGAILRVIFPFDNALYSIAFGTHKTAKSIEMPFGMMSGLDPRNSVLRGGDDPRWGSGNFGGKHENMPDKPNNCVLDWFVQRHKTGADA